MNYCPECGCKVYDGYVFCPECGYKLGQMFGECQFNPDDTKMHNKNNSIRCPECGEYMPIDMFYCLNCGHQFNTYVSRDAEDEDFDYLNQKIQKMQGTWKNKRLSLILCIFLGMFGIHRFYEGKVFTGVVYLFTLGVFGVGWIIDIIRISLKPNPYRVD